MAPTFPFRGRMSRSDRRGIFAGVRFIEGSSSALRASPPGWGDWARWVLQQKLELRIDEVKQVWVPACAGMTNFVDLGYFKNSAEIFYIYFSDFKS